MGNDVEYCGWVIAIPAANGGELKLTAPANAEPTDFNSMIHLLETIKDDQDEGF